MPSVSSRPSYLLGVAVAAVALVAACGTGREPNDSEGIPSTIGGSGGGYVADPSHCVADGLCLAFTSTFTGFRHWPSVPGVGPANAPIDTVVHVNDYTMTSYINELPPAGSTTFPLGTIIVKEQNEPPLTERKIFAMVKRGGGFNVNGAKDWEYFELQDTGDGEHVTIVWHGFGPPLGEAYGGNQQACNGCHAQAAYNDFIWTEGFTLSKL